MTDPLTLLGRPVRAVLESLGSYVRFVGLSAWAGLLPPYRLRLLFKQLYFVGNQSLSIVVVTAVFTGMVFAVQANIGFSMFGAEGLVGGVVALALTRELAPVLTALMVNGRVGSAMAAELGTMRVTEQIDALESMAVDPHQYLVAPRVAAAVLMCPALTLVFDAVGLLGCWYVAIFDLHVSEGGFWSRVEWYVDPDDIWGGAIKAAVFGFLLSTVGCWYGYFARGGAEGVGRATTRAVVASGVLILVVDYFVTLILVPLSLG